ncbi:MAG: rhamnulokinase [Chloroflexi bacterium]|nr:rhamnulokinase [Chloroflexota bacterium]
MTSQTVLAVDLGAESGRVMAVQFDGRALHTEELARFPNTPVRVNGTLHWNFLSLWDNIQQGIASGTSLTPASIGVDTWGVDFALLDEQGHLLGNPVHYRDSRTDNMMTKVFERIPRAEVFAYTGIEVMQINTLYQLMSLVVEESPLLQVADTLLLSPDLINYWLTGEKISEYSIASTTQMINPHTRSWATPMLETLGIPSTILPEIVPPGTRIGSYNDIPVIAPACHDTGSAVAAAPATTPHFGYISSGTWSLVGIETDAPVITPEAAAANITNEGGVFDTIRLLKNVMGLWIVQQCRLKWRAVGEDYSYATLVGLAEQATPLQSIIDPNDVVFLRPGDHPALIRAKCEATGQPTPETPGAVVRCVLESLALAYRDMFERLERVSGHRVDVIHIIGGGSQNTLLNQMTADASGKPVMAGPVEATVIGNALIQLITLGELGSLGEARQIVADMASTTRYTPNLTDDWQAAYERYNTL